MGHAGHGVCGLLNEIAKGAAADLKRSPTGLHPLEIQDVVDEANETVSVGDGDPEQILRFVVEMSHHAGREQAERPADAGQRGSKLMGYGGDELVFDGIKLGALCQLALLLKLKLVGQT